MWLTRNKWIIRYRVADKAWFVLTSRGKRIFARCCNVCQAVDVRATIDVDPNTFDEFQHWKREAGRACINFSLQKLAQKRRESKRSDHYEEF